MNGPYHYREAERLIEEAESSEEPISTAMWCVELAKVHTALARVAVTTLKSDGRNGSKSLVVGSAVDVIRVLGWDVFTVASRRAPRQTVQCSSPQRHSRRPEGGYQ